MSDDCDDDCDDDSDNKAPAIMMMTMVMVMRMAFDIVTDDDHHGDDDVHDGVDDITCLFPCSPGGGFAVIWRGPERTAAEDLAVHWSGPTPGGEMYCRRSRSIEEVVEEVGMRCQMQEACIKADLF